MRVVGTACGVLAAVLVTALVTAGCGYIGEPLPPALRRPVRVVDLTAVEHGSKIVIQFTIPKVTTEALPVRGDEDIELRIGPVEDPFQLAKWEAASERIPVDSKDKDGKPLVMARVEAPAARWYGKTVSIAVNVHAAGGRTAGWGNFVMVPVVPALPAPEGLVASNMPDAVRLDWHAAAGEFRIFRKLPDEPNPTQIGTSKTPSYLDTTIDYGKTYSYYVQSVEKTGDTYAESEISGIDSFKPVDTFPPAVPVGVSPVPGTRSIELVWDRNGEKDFASYRVYRDGRKIAEDLTAPAYSDRDVKQGVTYRYRVSAVDSAGNESAQSVEVEAALP